MSALLCRQFASAESSGDSLGLQSYESAGLSDLEWAHRKLQRWPQSLVSSHLGLRLKGQNASLFLKEIQPRMTTVSITAFTNSPHPDAAIIRC